MFEEKAEEKYICEKDTINGQTAFEGQQLAEKDEIKIYVEDVQGQEDEDLFNKNIFVADFEHYAQLKAENDIDSDAILQPLSERWSPLGADYDDAVSLASDLVCSNNSTQNFFAGSQETIQSKLDNDMESGLRYKNLEEEQELLTTSLLSLTSHFAHVQLRVRQIVEAPAPERDLLLKDLEEFAFRGVPDLDVIARQEPVVNEAEREATGKDKQQFRLIQHLKTQLTELEKLAYESGVPVLPQYMMLEKQKIIIDELKRRLNLRVEEQDLPQLSPDELRCQVDTAFGELMGPLKMRDQLVAQLKTQITDLERFIAFLQCDSEDVKQNMEKFSDAYNSYAAKSKSRESNAECTAKCLKKNGSTSKEIKKDNDMCRTNNFSSQAHGLLNKASVLMQIFATTHLGAAQNQFQKNTLKKTHKGNHWGDLRAQLEVDIQEVASLSATLSFDREKLAKIKCKTKMQTKTVITSQLALTKQTVAPAKYSTYHDTRHVSSDSDEDELNFYNIDENRSRSLPFICVIVLEIL